MSEKKKQKYYFIATVRRYKDVNANGIEYETEDSRTWGFYKSKRKAIRAVEENWSDMNEDGYYPWAVIGTYYEGLIGQSFDEGDEEIWFEQNIKELSNDELKEIYDNCPEDYREKCTINPKTKIARWYTPSGWYNNIEGYKRCEQPTWAKGFCGWAL